ncbi:hypothetical protein [Microbulbifer sp. SAOS-129_SWC]|uniref:hypothetical protein n=1 Tax=Microbulbifer sp. SAOS-129_SWC TaxID=3145235 RepID=UPI003217CFF5
MKYILILFLLLQSCIAVAERYEHAGAGFENKKELEEFYLKVRKAILSKDYQGLSELMLFPTGLYIGGNPTTVETAEEFVRLGDQILNDRLIQAVYCSNIDNLRSNYEGVMIGQGEIWIVRLDDGRSNTGKSVIFKINNNPANTTWERPDGECFYGEKVNKRL